jgi:hypothetical protein
MISDAMLGNGCQLGLFAIRVNRASLLCQPRHPYF